jgi:hypothetical protein
MVRRGWFQGLRRHGAALGAVLAYALLLNALATAVFNVQAVASALDPLAVAANCDTGSAPSGDPARHEKQHQPDCTLCSSACPMGGMAQALGGGNAAGAPFPTAGFVLRIGAPHDAGLTPPSIYLSDTDAQAPPAIG